MPPIQQLDSVLDGLAKDHATGSLRVGRAGSVYLSSGRVTYVESTCTPGVEEILTASGRVSTTTMRSTRQSATGTAGGGDALVRQGLLSRGELQLCVLGAILDASFFVLAATAPRPRFKEGDRHWLGDQWYFDVAGLVRECRRRRVQLDHVWPYPDLDSRPVVVAPRITSQRVVLTSVQWEVLVNADSTATPLDLARRLGRSAYSVLLAVRQLGAAGLLVEPPRDAPDPVPDASTPPLPKRAERTGPRPGAGLAAPSLSETAPRDAVAPPVSAAARPPQGVQSSVLGLPQVSGDATDIGVLLRLRDALERL